MRSPPAYQQRAPTSNNVAELLGYRTPTRNKPRSRPPTTTPPPPSSAKSFRKGPWIVGGLAVYSFTAYGFYLYRIYDRQAAASQELQVPENVLDRYERTARDYDGEVELAEKAMWMGRLRKSLAKRAYGDVLEVSVGTGRNAQYYELGKCRSVTMLDQSGEMVGVAREKFKDLHPNYKNCTFLTQPAEAPIPSPPPAGYDTILQTMGLCSTPNPASLLRHLGMLANQEHGQILLLEHGRGHYAWLNRILDNLAPHHADRYGCWWNRDIGKIVAESGLEVLKVKRYYLGTTWWVELRPRPGGSNEERQYGRIV